MFEAAERCHPVRREDFLREEATLRTALLDAQYDLHLDGRFALLVVIAGVEGAGKGETVNLLNEWMDPRHIVTSAFGPPSDEEADRPPDWRYWRALPPRGRIGIFFGAWHTEPIVRRVMGGLDAAGFERATARIQQLEQMLCDEGVLLVKYWFHLSKAQQQQRLKALRKNPDTRWRVSDTDRAYFRRHDRFVEVCEPFVRRTSTPAAPWTVVPGADPNERALTVGRHLLATLRARLDTPTPPRAAPAAPQPPLRPLRPNVITQLEAGAPLDRARYERRLAKWQARLNLAARDPRFPQLPVVAVFEGNDGAGKGGAIRRVTQALDARWYENVPIAAPSDEERAQPYLWRFWRRLPRRGRFVFFDRSWYGRVLVERVEGLCSDADGQRAYGEIAAFEQALLAHGTVLVKFWLAITKDEQYRRFKARETVPFKRFKITAEDWRNRERWDDYEAAVCEMVDRTSSPRAPWTLVAADDKLAARLQVLKTLTLAVEAGLGRVARVAR